MPTNTVVVYDIDSLEEFGNALSAKRREIETLYNSLNTLSNAQQGNWNDPQYDALRDNIEMFSSVSVIQLDTLDQFTGYISNLVAKLRDM